MFEKIKTYLKELTIVTAGVLIALIINNQKENYQARAYHSASIETIHSEIEANYSRLKGVINEHNRLMDTINRYSKDHISIAALFKKADGVQFASLNNRGLEFYLRNKINLVDFELMSTLYHLKFLSDLIDTKLERLSVFLYSNIQADSKESKMIVSLYLSDVLNSENQLLQAYKHLIDENIKPENNKNEMHSSAK